MATNLAWSAVFLVSNIAKYEASVPFEFDLCEELECLDLLDLECDLECDDFEIFWEFLDWPFELFEWLLDDFKEFCFIFSLFSLYELK